MKKEYCVIDIETTGGMAKRDRITEIAIVVTDGYQIIDKYQSLINPERSIPPEITRITGITNEMVEDAPRFYEIAKDVILMTENRVFIAHNVMFDYGFIREEFASLGYTFTRELLCTVRLSRKVFPGLKSYSLGNLIRHFNISVNDRHRAMEDTLATVKIFHMIAQSDILENPQKWLKGQSVEAKLPEYLPKHLIKELPEATGVYFFYDEHGKIIYIGKSINIRKRILQHFSRLTGKMEKLMQKTRDISYELTGSELVALLHENSLIKKHNPEINRAQRKKTYKAAIRKYYDIEGYLCLESCKINPHDITQIKYCKDSKHAGMLLQALREEYMLCESKLLFSGQSSHCFSFEIDKCLGACRAIETPDEYNLRAEVAMKSIDSYFDKDFILKLPGRNMDELAFVLVKDSHYKGFCFIDKYLHISDVLEVVDHITPESFDPEANRILKTYITQNRVEFHYLHNL